MIYLLIIVVLLLWLVMPLLGAIATIILPWCLGMSLIYVAEDAILWLVAIWCILGAIGIKSADQP